MKFSWRAPLGHPYPLSLSCDLLSRRTYTFYDRKIDDISIRILSSFLSFPSFVLHFLFRLSSNRTPRWWNGRPLLASMEEEGNFYSSARFLEEGWHLVFPSLDPFNKTNLSFDLIQYNLILEDIKGNIRVKKILFTFLILINWCWFKFYILRLIRRYSSSLFHVYRWDSIPSSPTCPSYFFEIFFFLFSYGSESLLRQRTKGHSIVYFFSLKCRCFRRFVPTHATSFSTGSRLGVR